MKNEVIEQSFGDPMLQNRNFEANKNKNKSKKCILKIEGVDFCESSRAKFQFLENLKSQNLTQFLRFGPEFCM